MKRNEGLEIEQDLDFEERSRRWQFGLQALLLVFVILAIVGVFGDGPVARQTARDEKSGFQVEHPRLLRRMTEYDLRIQLPPDAAKDGKVQLWIDRSLTDKLKWDTALPDPESVRLEGDRLLFEFNVKPGEILSEIICHFEPAHIGRAQGRIGLISGPEVQVGYFIYP